MKLMAQHVMCEVLGGKGEGRACPVSLSVCEAVLVPHSSTLPDMHNVFVSGYKYNS